MTQTPKQICALAYYIDKPEVGTFAPMNKSHPCAEWYTLTSHHTAEIAKRDRAIEVLIEVLKKHHDWHQKEIGEIMFPEAKDVVIDMSDAYAESALCDETCDALRQAQAILGEPYQCAQRNGQDETQWLDDKYAMADQDAK